MGMAAHMEWRQTQKEGLRWRPEVRVLIKHYGCGVWVGCVYEGRLLCDLFFCHVAWGYPRNNFS